MIEEHSVVCPVGDLNWCANREEQCAERGENCAARSAWRGDESEEEERNPDGGKECEAICEGVNAESDKTEERNERDEEGEEDERRWNSE